MLRYSFRLFPKKVTLSCQVTQQLKALCETLALHGNNGIIPGCAEAIETQLQRAKPVWEELEEIIQSV
jgi:hypothetical protein